MARHHTIVSIVALMGALSLAPATANASGPLLSGYGGPGAGEQAILGSQLLHGSSPSRPSSAAIKTTATEAQKSQVAQEPATGRAPVQESSTQLPASGTGRSAPEAALSRPQRSAQRVPAQTERSSSSGHSEVAPERESSPQGSSSEPVAVSRASYDTRLGLSGGDVLLLVLVLGGLVAIAILTRRLARLQP